MYKKIRDILVEVLEGIAGEALDVTYIRESHVADLCSQVAFRLAEKQGKNPKELAEDIVDGIDAGGLFGIRRVEAFNGYINFYLDYDGLFISLMDEIKAAGGDYGRSAEKREKIILEHSSLNPSGPVHVGRLRNSLIGDSLSRILEFNGFCVETHYYVNDIGKQIAIIAQGFSEGVEPDKEVEERYRRYRGKKDFRVFFEYVAANRRFEGDEGFRRRVQELIRRAEFGDKESLKEITETAKECLEGQREVFDILGIRFDQFDYESDFILDGRVSEVISFLEKSVFARETDNGFGLDLSKFGIEKRGGVSILRRRDGTSVYLARDIAYHLYKTGLGGIILNVLGEDHKLEFRELRTVLDEVYGVDKRMEAIHFSFVNFEGVELSTRRGQTAPVDLLIDDAIEKAEREVSKRKLASGGVASVIGIGAIKYHILKTAPMKPINFRWEDALNFDGDSSPYIQYAHARCCSLLEKSGISVEDVVLPGLGADLVDEEGKLLHEIMRFPVLVEAAGDELKPSIVAGYLYNLASEFSRFYKQCPVLSEGDLIRKRRLLIINAVRQTLRNGLYLLGIKAPEKM